MACGFKEGEKLDPGGTGLVRFSEIPAECGEEVVYLSKLLVVLGVPMIAERERMETEGTASTSVTVRKFDGNLHFGNNDLAFAVGVGAEGIGMLEFFVGENHGDDDFLELEHKFAVVELALRIIFGDIMGIITNELETVIGGTV